MKISIKTANGKRISQEIEDSSNTINIKIHGQTSQIVLDLGHDHPCPDVAMRIFVSTIKDKTFVLELKLNFLGTELDNNQTVAYYNIKHDSNLVIMQSCCIC
ncbi:unnamed protein product [Cochlearia groenlandica]